MGRLVGSVAAGFLSWTALWLLAGFLVGTALPQHVVPGQRVDHPGVLVLYLVSTVVASLAGGYVCAALARERRGAAVRALALLLLAVGAVVEIAGWDLTPAWYHLVFLALLVPATLAGARLRTGSVR